MTVNMDRVAGVCLLIMSLVCCTMSWSMIYLHEIETASTYALAGISIALFGLGMDSLRQACEEEDWSL